MLELKSRQDPEGLTWYIANGVETMIPSKEIRNRWREEIAKSPFCVNREFSKEAVASLLDCIDFQENVLRKYIQHVGDCEGVDFLRDGDSTELLSEEEWEFLRRMR